MMVGAVVVKLTPSESTAALEISNSSMSNDSSTDEYKVMVAATVTVLSGIIQVSAFLCNWPSPPRAACPHWYTSFCSVSFLPTPPPLFSGLAFHSQWPIGKERVSSPQPEAEEQIHIAKVREHRSREKEK